ncbi:MAG: hypothetical protein O2865_11915, partial [Planctomycetota bacterium]|nr:hypothetical protein [Planctomycetota bacterium]
MGRHTNRAPAIPADGKAVYQATPSPVHHPILGNPRDTRPVIHLDLHDPCTLDSGQRRHESVHSIESRSRKEDLAAISLDTAPGIGHCVTRDAVANG